MLIRKFEHQSHRLPNPHRIASTRQYRSNLRLDGVNGKLTGRRPGRTSVSIVDGLDGPVVIATRQITQLMTQALTHITKPPTRRATEDIVVAGTSPYTDVVSQACRGIVTVVIDGRPRELDLIAVVKTDRILRYRWVLVRIE